MLMIGLFLNPILRVSGFFAILVALKPIGVLSQWLIQYLNGVILSGGVMLFILLGCMAVICIFAYSSMVRIFSLPSEIFERGLRWINGGQEVTGDSGAEHQTRQTVAAFASKSEHASHAAKMQSPGKPSPGGEGGTIRDGGGPAKR